MTPFLALPPLWLRIVKHVPLFLGQETVPVFAGWF